MKFTDLLASFVLQPISENDTQLQAKGLAKDDTGQRVYGGQLMAQLISAAQMSVHKDYLANVFHCHFLRTGSSENDIIYKVEKLMTGRSFATRAVTAWQNERPICHASLSFHKSEVGPEHAASMPKVAEPETLRSDKHRVQKYFAKRGIANDYDWPIDVRFTDPMDLENPSVKPPHAQVWVTANGEITSAEQQAQMLAYASDNPTTAPVFNPFGTSPILLESGAMTLNHSLWFHRPSDVTDWLLFDLRSDVANSGRGLAHANIFSRDGQLVATACQEVLVRAQA